MVDGKRMPRMDDVIAGCRVLIVEDEPLVARATARLIERWGGIATVVTDVRDALELLGGDRPLPEAIVLDAFLRGGDASDVDAQLRRRSASTGVVLVSGHDDLIWDFAGRLRVDAVVAKSDPDGPQKLREGLRHAIAAANRRRPTMPKSSNGNRLAEDRASRRDKILKFFLRPLRSELPPAEFDALCMRVSGLPDEDIAKTRNIKPDSARHSYNRALDRVGTGGDPYGLLRVVADLLADAPDLDPSHNGQDGLDWLAALEAAARRADSDEE